MQMLGWQWFLLILLVLTEDNGLVSGGWMHRRGSASAKSLLLSVAPTQQTMISTRLFMNGYTSAHITDDISLTSLIHTETDGFYVGEGLKNWLNRDYLQQAVHSEVAEKVRLDYIHLRQKGIHEIYDTMIYLGKSLEKFHGINDCFADAWEIANKASDFLLVLLGRESDADLMDLMQFTAPLRVRYEGGNHLIRTEDLSLIHEELETVSARYRLIQDFFDGEVSWKTMMTVVAVVLGYRADEAKRQIRQFPEVTPLGWEDLDAMPPFADPNDEALAKRMMNDYPERDIEILLHAIIGQDYYKSLYNSQLPENLHKIRLAEWMCIHGFLTEQFPLRARYVPEHLETRFSSEPQFSM